MTETVEVREIVTFPTEIRHPETGDWVRVVGYKRPYEYMDGVYAYADPETGAFGGMFMESAEEVEARDE